MAGATRTAGNGPLGDESAFNAVDPVGRADRDARSRDRDVSAARHAGGGVGVDSRLRRVQQFGPLGADRRNQAIPATGELGELLGIDAELPQFGRDEGPARLDYEARQRDGTVYSRPDGDACAEARRFDEGMVRSDQEAAWLEDRAGGGDAPLGDDHLAHAQT